MNAIGEVSDKPKGSGKIALATENKAATEVSPNSQSSLKMACESWKDFAKNMILKEGMPIMDPGSNYTTSEAVSYTLLQAAIFEDFVTFDKVLAWAEKHLKRSDNLFGWEWKDGTFTQNGKDPASDADQDIAAALAIAWKKTGKAAYKEKSQETLTAIWQREVVRLKNGDLLLTAGAQEALYLTDTNGQKVYGVNPSYFRPTYYLSLFPEIAPEFPWKELLKTSYAYIEKGGDAASLHGSQKGSPNLNAQIISGTRNLPPDTFAVYPDGRITDHAWKERNDYCMAGDGWRTLFWMALQNNYDPQDSFAKRYLTEKNGIARDAGPMFFLKTQVETGQELRSGYQLNGEPLYDVEGLKQGNEWPFTERLWNDAIAYTYFKQAKEEKPARIMLERIETKFKKNGQWGDQDPYDKKSNYYGQSWMRFAVLLEQLGAKKILSGEKLPK